MSYAQEPESKMKALLLDSKSNRQKKKGLRSIIKEKTERPAIPEDVIDQTSMEALLHETVNKAIDEELAFLKAHHEEVVNLARFMITAETQKKLPDASTLSMYHRATAALGLLGRYKIPLEEDRVFVEDIIKKTGVIEDHARRDIESSYLPTILNSAFMGASKATISYEWGGIMAKNNFYATFLAIRSLKRVVEVLKSNGFDVIRQQDTIKGAEDIIVCWSPSVLKLLAAAAEKKGEDDDKLVDTLQKLDITSENNNPNPGPHAITGI